jgi:hypothetical protein
MKSPAVRPIVLIICVVLTVHLYNEYVTAKNRPDPRFAPVTLQPLPEWSPNVTLYRPVMPKIGRDMQDGRAR